MSAGIPYHLYNSFTLSNPYSGSQCAIVFLEAGDERLEDERWLQDIGSYFAFPATAFVRPRGTIKQGKQGDGEAEGEGEGEGESDTRWFSTQELTSCGHGTLAASQAIFNIFPLSSITFHTRHSSVPYTASKAGDQIQISLPIPQLDQEPVHRDTVLKHVIAATGLGEDDVVNVARYPWGGGSYIVQLDPKVDLEGLDVEPSKLKTLAPGQIAFTQSLGIKGDKLNIQSRVFLPHYTPVEDPVTGSAHTALTGYYTTHPSQVALAPSSLDLKDITISARQLSKRGGAITLRNVDGRAVILGTAREIGRGELNLL